LHNGHDLSANPSDRLCGFGERKHHADDSLSFPRKTTTGQCAWWTQCWLTDPSSMPANAPSPREPITSSCAWGLRPERGGMPSFNPPGDRCGAPPGGTNDPRCSPAHQ
jgi:hypothetical protein